MDQRNEPNVKKPPCESKKLCDMCKKYVDKIPCCSTIAFRKHVYRNWTKLLSGKADCVDLFAIKKDLLKTQAFNFKATTWCMFPVLQKGDDLIVEDAGYDDMQVGDLPAYKGGDHLFTHRIVGKKEVNGKRFLVTRPDTSKVEGDKGELIAEEDILGKVREVRRKDQVCSQQQRSAEFNDQVVYKKEKFKDKCFMLCIKALETVQQFALYKKIARYIGKSFLDKVGFVVSLPITKSLAVYQHRPMEKVSPEELARVSFFHIVMVLNKKALGVMTVFNRPQECPYKGLWMAAMFIRRPYRKTGLEEVFLKKSEGFLKKNFKKPLQRSETLCEMKTFI